MQNLGGKQSALWTIGKQRIEQQLAPILAPWGALPESSVEEIRLSLPIKQSYQ